MGLVNSRLMRPSGINQMTSLANHSAKPNSTRPIRGLNTIAKNVDTPGV
jgi:hypothetical protein